MTKAEWEHTLSTFSVGGKAQRRSEIVWKRMQDILKNIEDNTKIHLVFYTVWGQELNIRMLTVNDSYIFNRLPDPRYTTSVPLKMDEEERRLALGFCFQELHKKYDATKAATFSFLALRASALEIFTTAFEILLLEFIVYMLQQIRPLYRQYYPKCHKRPEQNNENVH